MERGAAREKETQAGTKNKQLPSGFPAADPSSSPSVFSARIDMKEEKKEREVDGGERTNRNNWGVMRAESPLDRRDTKWRALSICRWLDLPGRSFVRRASFSWKRGTATEAAYKRREVHGTWKRREEQQQQRGWEKWRISLTSFRGNLWETSSRLVS